jgi:hypothetical protein
MRVGNNMVAQLMNCISLCRLPKDIMAGYMVNEYAIDCEKIIYIISRKNATQNAMW